MPFPQLRDVGVAQIELIGNAAESELDTFASPSGDF